MTLACRAIAVAVALSGMAGEISYAQTEAPALTGAQIAEQVNAALAENGQSGSAMIASDRRYYPCDGALSVTPRRDERWDAVDVGCAGPLHWNIVVRTSANGDDASAGEDGGANGAVQNSAVVLKHSVRKGDVLTLEQLEILVFEKGLAPGIYATPDELVGRRMAQSLGAGVPIRARHLDRNWAVIEGAPVIIEMKFDGVAVSTTGEALENGQVGDSVSVKNLRSGKIVRGFVTDEKTVSLVANIN